MVNSGRFAPSIADTACRHSLAVTLGRPLVSPDCAGCRVRADLSKRTGAPAVKRGGPPWIGHGCWKISPAVVDQLPKLTSNAVVNVSDLLTKRGSEVSAIRRTIPDYSIALQRLVGRHRHRARKPPTNRCSKRVCVGRQQFFLVAQYLRDHPLRLGCVDLNVCHRFPRKNEPPPRCRSDYNRFASVVRPRFNDACPWTMACPADEAREHARLPYEKAAAGG